MLLSALRWHVVWIILCGILMLAPCANLVILLLINSIVTRKLIKAGLKVGLMGVDPEQVERVLNADLCKTCGYNLTGNVTGVCSECGTEVDRASSQVD